MDNEVTITDLLLIIGEKDVEIRLLRQKLQELTQDNDPPEGKDVK